MYGHETSIERRYKGFRIYGDARSVHNESPRWFAVGQVFVDMPNGSLYGVEDFSDPSLAYEDEELAAWFGLGLAEIVVDHLVPPAEYYLTPMNPAWAVDLLAPRGAGRGQAPVGETLRGDGISGKVARRAVAGAPLSPHASGRHPQRERRKTESPSARPHGAGN